MPEKIGDRIAEANARQAKIGKWLQWQGIKAIAEKRLKPKNFTQARDSIKEGTKIEQEALESAKKHEPKYGFSDSEEVKKPKPPVISSAPKPVQTVTNTPAVDPQLLAEIQRRLKDIKEGMDRLKV